MSIPNLDKQSQQNSIVLLQQQSQIEHLMKNVDYSANLAAYFNLREKKLSIRQELQQINKPQTFLETLGF